MNGPEKVTRTANVFYDPKTMVIQDYLLSNGLSEFEGLTKAEMETRDGKTYAIGYVWDIHKLRENTFITKPERITKTEFIRMLEVLPPLHWRGGNGIESFMISELIYGDIANIYARIGDKYYHLSDHSSLSHEQIIEKCRTWEAEQS